MSAEIKTWPKAQGEPRPLPSRLVRPCDYSLFGAVSALETQLGTIEAYNRLVDAACGLRARIEAGEARAQNPIFAKNPKGQP